MQRIQRNMKFTEFSAKFKIFREQRAADKTFHEHFIVNTLNENKPFIAYDAIMTEESSGNCIRYDAVAAVADALSRRCSVDRATSTWNQT